MPQGPGTYGTQRGRPRKNQPFSTPIQSRMPSSSNKGQAGKKAAAPKKTAAKKPAAKKKGIIASLKARRAKRASENKWVLMEKMTDAGRKRATARKASRRLKKAGVTVSPSMARQSGKVRRGVKGAEVTKGGAYAKYKKGSRPAKSFQAAFAKNCKGKGADTTFTWDGRSYSCAKK